MGGPVSNENDEIDITLGSQTSNFASPYTYSAGDPTTYTIDLSTLFANTILGQFEALFLEPTRGDGVRLFSIVVERASVPESASTLGLLSLALAGIGSLRFAARKK